MPEGDTVWRTAHRLHLALADQTLIDSDLRVPQAATVDLSGRAVLRVCSRGKHLLTRIEGGVTLHSHLGMDGAWYLRRRGDRYRGGPAHQLRAVLSTSERTALGYRLPVLQLLGTGEEERVVGHLGPDPLGPDWDPERALRLLLADPARPVSETLLDQRVLAGVGNVYASELCFFIRMAPWAPVGTVPEPDRLIALAARLLRANSTRAVRNTTGDPRRGHELAVYGREHRPCPRCGTAVRRGRHGPADRSRVVFHCPGCQSAPPPPSAASSASLR